MVRNLVRLLVPVLACLAMGSLAAHAERLQGQYRGPTDKLPSIKETPDTSAPQGDGPPPGDGAADGETRGGKGESSGGDSGGGGDAPVEEPSRGGEGEEYRGPSGDTPPPSMRGTGDSPPPSDEGKSDDPAREGAPPSDAPSAGGGGSIGGGLGQAPGGAGKKKTDTSEGLRVWSFYWERNRERLLHDLIAARRSGTQLTPWSSSWVLGRGDKTLRRALPVTHAVITDEILPVLRRQRTSENPLVRDAAVVALGKVGGADVVPLLAGSALKDEDPEVREDATLALGLTRRPEALPALFHVLRGTGIPGGETNLNQRCFAAFALGLLGQPDAAAVMTAEFRKASRAGASESLLASISLGIGLLGQESTVDDLGEMLLDPRLGTTVKAHTASALGKIAHLDASRALQRAWKGSHPDVRGSIALAMGSYAEPTAVAFLDEEGLGDGEGQNRNFSAISMARIGSELPSDSIARRRVLQRLFERAVKPQRNTTLAEHAALGLAMLGEDAVLPELREMAESRKQKHHVRSAMAISVGILGDRSSADRLRELLGNRGEDPKLRSYAALALAFLGDADEIPNLKAQYERADRARDVQRGCVLAIGVLGDAKDVDFLVDRVLVEAEGPTVRGAAVIALGLMRDATAVPRLIEIVNSRTPEFSVEDKAFAVAALGYLADKDPFPYLSRLFENCNHRHDIPQLIQVLRIL